MSVDRGDIDLLEDARKLLVRIGERGIADEVEDLLQHLRLSAIGLR